jgi:hypothetical protein
VRFCRHWCRRKSWSRAHFFGHLVTQIAATNWLHCAAQLESRSTRELTVARFASALPYLVAQSSPLKAWLIYQPALLNNSADGTAPSCWHDTPAHLPNTPAPIRSSPFSQRNCFTNQGSIMLPEDAPRVKKVPCQSECFFE